MTLLYQSLPSLVYSVPRSSLGWSSAKFSSVPYLSTLITVITFPIIYFTTIVLVIISLLFTLLNSFIFDCVMATCLVRFWTAENRRSSRISRNSNFIHLISLTRSLTRVAIRSFPDAKALVTASIKCSSDTPFLRKSLIFNKRYVLVMPFPHVLKNNFSKIALSYLTIDFT